MLSDLLRQHYPSEWTENSVIGHPSYETIEIAQQDFPDIIELKTDLLKFNARITRIIRVKNSYLYGCFLLKKAEYESKGSPVEITKLYHVTDETKVDSILNWNFDHTKIDNNRYGHGIYFTPFPSHGDKYATCNRSNRVVIATDVLIGTNERIYGADYGRSLPADYHDTTIACYDVVYVKYYDNEFYPKYVIYYEIIAE